MIKRSLLPGICLALMVAAGCSEDDLVTQRFEGYDQGADKTLILVGEPIDAVYITSEGYVSENYSSSYTVGWGDLGILSCPYPDEDCYDWVSYGAAVAKELFAEDNGSIDITITGSPVGTIWSVFHYGPTDLQLERVDSVRAANYTYNISWRYTIREPGKGYICCIGVPPPRTGYTSRSLGIMYDHGFMDTITVAVESVTWHYSITEKTSDLNVAIEGSTNAQQLLIETYGDGIRWVKSIPLDSDGSFSREYWLAFIYEGEDFLKHDTKLYVFGTVGMPKVIHLRNPLGASPDARLIP